jgi:addiction module HigA family antidote
MPIKNPPHPGDFIRTEIIAPTGLSVTAAAALRVSRPTLSSLLKGKADLSGDMTLRIDKAFGVKMGTLMRMQSAYDIAQTRKREKQIRVRRIYQFGDAHAQVRRIPAPTTPASGASSITMHPSVPESSGNRSF